MLVAFSEGLFSRNLLPDLTKPSSRSNRDGGFSIPSCPGVILLLIQQGIDGTHHFGRLPILRAYDLARQTAFAVDQEGFRKHGGSVLGGTLLASVTVGGEYHVVVHEEFFVGCLVFVHAHAEHDPALGRNVLLQVIERLGFFEARRTPRRPKIEDHDFTAQIGQVCGARNLKREVFGSASGKAGFALTISGRREYVQNRCHQDQSNGTEDFVLHVRCSTPYNNTLFRQAPRFSNAAFSVKVEPIADSTRIGASRIANWRPVSLALDVGFCSTGFSLCAVSNWRKSKPHRLKPVLLPHCAICASNDFLYDCLRDRARAQRRSCHRFRCRVARYSARNNRNYRRQRSVHRRDGCRA